MAYETYQCLWKPEEGAVLRSGQSLSLHLNGSSLHQADRVFVTGETVLFYLWKNEPDYPQLYRRIDDALDPQNACQNAYSLHFAGRNDSFPIRAFTKVMWKPRLSYLPLHSYSENWDAGLSVKARDLRVHEGGYLRMAVEVRYKKPDIGPHAAWGPADARLTLDIPEGTYDWQTLRDRIVIPTEETANVFIVLEGLRFEGDVWFEEPSLISSNGYNILSDFSVYTEDRPQFNWMGQNLSRKEWPSFDVSLNGVPVFSGEIFERSHRYSEWEFPVPAGTFRDGDNEMVFTLTSDYREPLPYRLFEVGAITHTDSASALRLIAVPENVSAGKEFPILIRTEEADMTLSFASDSLRLISSPHIQEAGLHVLRLISPSTGTHLRFTLQGCEGEIRRSVLRLDDHIVTGTGDMIYINQNMNDAEEFLCWYLSSGIGNLLTIRPTYRWSGSRTVDVKMWEQMVRLLNEMEVHYVHMLDGRELPGVNANPSYALLNGPYFLGRQLHERDGAIAYWGYKDFTGQDNEALYYDMMNRMLEEYPEENNPAICPENIIEKDGRLSLYRDIHLPADMKTAAEHAVSQLSRARYGATRHTGPSTLFRYFFQAGFSWIGAELMYGPMELVIAAQRGAAACYGSEALGGHLAVQWSTTPHDIAVRYRRYRLALYVSYMQGLTEINTEEGLWHMEEYYIGHNRFGEACTNHLKMQQDFYRYVSSHTRSGSFYTPIAFLYGRYDGWRVFGRENVWGRPDFPMADPEKSWDQIGYYYPLSLQDAIYRHPCTEGPVGFYTGTPHGNIDIVPIETKDLDGYKTAVMIGYNCASSSDLDMLEAFVKKGGTLLIGWPQLSLTTDRADVVNLKHEYLTHPFIPVFAGKPEFTLQHVNGRPLQVGGGCSEGKALILTDEGLPLVTRTHYGEGLVYFFNTASYVADPAVTDAFRTILNRVTLDTLDAEPSYMEADETVQFTVYTQPDGSRHYYVLAIDWFNPEDTPHKATLRIGSREYGVDVPWGALLKIVVNGDTAAWCTGEDGEVLAVRDTVLVQGVDTCTFRIAKDGSVREQTVNFADEAVKKLEF